MPNFCSDDYTNDRNGKFPPVKRFQIVFITFGLVFLLIDLFVDVYLLQNFWRGGHLWYFLFTLILYLLPSMMMSAMSIFMCHSAFLAKDKIPLNHSFWRWTCWKVIHFTNLSLIWRYMEILCQYFKNKHLQNPAEQLEGRNESLENFLENFYANARDIFFLRFVEAYAECGPQLLLRLHMLAKGIQMEPFPEVMYATVIFSWLSMAWSSANYERWRLYCMKGAKPINLTETVFYFFFYAFTLASRVCSMAMFASIYGRIFFVCCGIHWLVMTVFILAVKVLNNWHFEEEPTENLFFSVVLGFTYLFSYIDAKEGPTWWERFTRDQYQSFSAPCFIIYHLIIYIETIAIMIIICINYKVAPVLVFDASIVAFLICVFFALGTMLKIVVSIQVDPSVTAMVTERQRSGSQQQLIKSSDK